MRQKLDLESVRERLRVPSPCSRLLFKLLLCFGDVPFSLHRALDALRGSRFVQGHFFFQGTRVLQREHGPDASQLKESITHSLLRSNKCPFCVLFVLFCFVFLWNDGKKRK